jgi:Ca-activated chloride channel family protein
MRSVFLSILFLAAVFAGTTVYGQVRRDQGQTTGKKNQRTEAAPTPIPTPTPIPPAGNQADDGEVIKVNTQLVTVPVRVLDRKGRFMSGLTKENFKVFENGREQTIEMFSNENEPFTVALVLDMSYSTKFKIADIQSAAIAFIEQLRPQDKVMVVSFDGDVHVNCEATSERKEIHQAIRSTKISTGTSLYEAIDLVINNRLASIEGRKAVILFSDGVDTTSRRANDMGNLHDAMEQEAIIYTIRYDTFNDVQSMSNIPVVQKPKISIPTKDDPIPNLIPTIAMPGTQGTTQAEYEKAAEYLDQLAFRTGGTKYDALNLGNLADAYSKIASELREFYSVGYYPSEERLPGKTSSVKVRVDRDGVAVKARENYTKRRKPVVR